MKDVPLLRRIIYYSLYGKGCERSSLKQPIDALDAEKFGGPNFLKSRAKEEPQDEFYFRFYHISYSEIFLKLNQKTSELKGQEAMIKF